MDQIDLHKLAMKQGGRFRLSSMVYKRMQQLNQEGARPPSNGALIRSALREVNEGEVTLAASATEAAAQALFKDAPEQPVPPTRKKSARKPRRSVK